MAIFGHKTEALFDIWSIEHFISGMAMIMIVRLICIRLMPDIFKSGKISEKSLQTIQIGCLLVIALFWECIEFYLEAGYTGVEKITYWFHGVEYWGNRLITDPLITIAGGYVGLKYYNVVFAARVVSIGWLVIHIFFLPHSMYLQEGL